MPSTHNSSTIIEASAAASNMASQTLQRIPSRTPTIDSDADWDKKSIRKTCHLTRTQLILFVVLIGFIILGTAGGLVTWALIKRANDGNHVDVPSSTNLTIVPMPDLKRSFYGITYTPLNAQYPECGVTLGDVVEDVKVLSQLTTRLRLYGMDCNQATYTLEAIKQLKVNMKIVVTIWMDDNDETYKRQSDLFWKMLEKYGDDNIIGVSVGNEVMFRKQATEAELISRIGKVRQELRKRGYSMPVYTTDIGDVFNEKLINATDAPLANVHPFFAGVSAEEAAEWTWKFFEEHIHSEARALGKTAIISETGWPTRGDPEEGSVPSVKNLQRFIDDFVCQSNEKGIAYYFFEAFDQPWKEVMFLEREGYWGILDKNRKPKVKFPDCNVKAESS
jgi:exo-beta-1,3-glucanase (GH17 family)